MAKPTHHNVTIIGGGITGLAAALGLAQRGITGVLIAPDNAEPDGKTSALLNDTVEFLESLSVWQEAKSIAFPLKTMRIIDGTNRLIRAPQTDFNASEIGFDAFGYNIENKKLGALLAEKLQAVDGVVTAKTELKEIYPANAADGSGPYRLVCANGKEFTADIVIAADGRNSVVRADLGMGERVWQYPQIALVANFTHTLPNNDTSTEFHTESGPFTLVPLGQKRSSLVYVASPQNAERLMALSKSEFELHIEQKMQSVLGKIRLETTLKSFPLSGMVANRFGKGSALLVGEAAHVFPPIGAQGLNLGLRDVATALDLVQASSHDVTHLGERFHSARARDIHTRTASVDVLNRSLLSDFLPVQAGRSLGLYALGNISALRRFAMREGIAPGSGFKNPFEAFGNKLKSSRSTSDIKSR